MIVTSSVIPTSTRSEPRSSFGACGKTFPPTGDLTTTTTITGNVRKQKHVGPTTEGSLWTRLCVTLLRRSKKGSNALQNYDCATEFPSGNIRFCPDNVHPRGVDITLTLELRSVAHCIIFYWLYYIMIYHIKMY